MKATRRFAALLCCLIMAGTTMAQHPTGTNAQAKLFAHELETLGHKVNKGDTAFIEKYALVCIKRTYYVPATVTFRHSPSKRECRKYGVKIQSKVNDTMATALLSTRKYKKLINSGLCEMIDISYGIKPRNIGIR